MQSKFGLCSVLDRFVLQFPTVCWTILVQKKQKEKYNFLLGFASSFKTHSFCLVDLMKIAKSIPEESLESIHTHTRKTTRRIKGKHCVFPNWAWNGTRQNNHSFTRIHKRESNFNILLLFTKLACSNQGEEGRRRNRKLWNQGFDLKNACPLHKKTSKKNWNKLSIEFP